MTDAEIVVEASRAIEKYLREQMGAKGRGLGQMAWSVRDRLAPTLFTGIVHLNKIRNKFMHQENFPIDIGTPKFPQLETREQFEALYADISRRIEAKTPRIPRPPLPRTNETQPIPMESNAKAALPKKITLKAFNGRYVTAEINGNRALIANRDKADAWETFELTELSDGRIALRAANGLFVYAQLHAHSDLVADRPEAGDWESFTISRFPDGNIALQAANGLYVSAKMDEYSQLVADRKIADGWELFTMTPAA